MCFFMQKKYSCSKIKILVFCGPWFRLVLRGLLTWQSQKRKPSVASSSTFMVLFFKLKSDPLGVYIGMKREVRNHKASAIHFNILSLLTFLNFLPIFLCRFFSQEV